VIDRTKAPATSPPSGIEGLDPAWSRLVDSPDADGVSRRWHLLDNWQLDNADALQPSLTVLCVHGNPSWSFLWRHLIKAAPDSIRVIAVDQLDMGFSERTGVKRHLGTRIEDLTQLTRTRRLIASVNGTHPRFYPWSHEYVTPSAQACGQRRFLRTLP